MVPMNGHTRGAKPLLQEPLEGILRQDQQERVSAAGFGKVNLALTCCAFVEGQSFDAAPALNSGFGQAHGIQQFQGRGVQGARVAAGGGAGFAINQANLQAPFRQQQRRPQPDRPGPDHQHLRLIVTHNIFFCCPDVPER
jgi:hypothetical protein